MMALVRVSAPPGAGNGIVEIGSLPEPPALRYMAFAVHCRDETEVREAVVWYRMLLDERPGAPLGLIARADSCIQPVAGLNHSLVFAMDPSLLNGGGLPESALQTLREAGIEARMLEEVVREYGPEVLSEEETLRALIARAAAGGTIGGAARDLGVHPDTLARRLAAVGLSARWLRQWVRLRAYGLRVQMGMDSRVALMAGGWADQQQRRKTAARFRGR